MHTKAPLQTSPLSVTDVLCCAVVHTFPPRFCAHPRLLEINPSRSVGASARVTSALWKTGRPPWGPHRHGDVPQVRLPEPFRARGWSARSDAVSWAREIPAPQAHTRPDAPDNDSIRARESDIVAGSTGHLGYLCGRPASVTPASHQAHLRSTVLGQQGVHHKVGRPQGGGDGCHVEFVEQVEVGAVDQTPGGNGDLVVAVSTQAPDRVGDRWRPCTQVADLHRGVQTA